ncbi:MAG: hypothetical protein KBS59_00910, partial [Clostridiales bacterium]|nr:hypothetical protein [Clostridiales bacterium]
LGRWSTIKEVYVESREGGTIIDTAVYDRNMVMKQLYKCDILGLYLDDADTLMKNDILAGTNDYDFISNEYRFFSMGTSGENYLNIWDHDFDFNLSGWNMALINETSIVDNNGVKKLYTFDGDFSLIGYKGIWGLTMNLDLYNQNFTEDIFEIVKNKEWTMDKVTELCSKVKKENGDQTWKPGEDTFGLETSAFDAYGLLTAAGLKFVTPDETGKFSTSADHLKANDAANIITKIGEYYSQDYMVVNVGYSQYQADMESGKTLLIGEVIDIVERMKDVEDLNVTLLPEPLYKAGDDYKSYVNNKTSLYYISKNACNGDKNMISDFWNLYTYHSNKIVLPAFKTAFGSLYCQNEKAVDMLDIIMGSRTYDFAYYGADFYGTVSSWVATGENNLGKAATKEAKTIAQKLTTRLESVSK